MKSSVIIFSDRRPAPQKRHDIYRAPRRIPVTHVPQTTNHKTIYSIVAAVFPRLLILSLLLLTALSSLLIEPTVAYYTDAEASNGNRFTAGLFDFKLSNTRGFSGSTTAEFFVAVQPFDGVESFQYSITTSNFDGDEDFCSTLVIDAYLDDGLVHSGNVRTYNQPATSTLGTWQFVVTEDPSSQGFCSFGFDFVGSQAGRASIGYTDLERFAVSVGTTTASTTAASTTPAAHTIVSTTTSNSAPVVSVPMASTSVLAVHATSTASSTTFLASSTVSMAAPSTPAIASTTATTTIATTTKDKVPTNATTTASTTMESIQVSSVPAVEPTTATTSVEATIKNPVATTTQEIPELEEVELSIESETDTVEIVESEAVEFLTEGEMNLE